ncbi:D-alanyl-D-alanine carboxypeptidase family protein [Patescibacteria group bacterium]|nr:D-alanyl-D-alanine carboxypeptidase family protein [Patescibacteria group bacterium]MBU1705722.1 D-alanyl-D-alanine carboxypeptidase family protein [Patescibacteria group bacterium]
MQTDPNAEIKIVPYQTPQLAVPIPGLSFSEPLRKGNKLSIDFIGEYFSSVYQWLIGASLTIAIVMVMIGGLQYVLSAGRGDAGEAKTRISNAVIGFVLLLGTYAILYTVNPELTLLRPVIVQQVASAPGLPFGEGEENSISGLAPPADLRNAAGANILNPKPAGSLITQEAAQAVEQAAGNLNGKNYGLYISSGFRSVEKQIALIRQNCQNEPGSATCNRKPNRPSTCILKNLDPKNCPHTTARAVDIWAAEKYEDKWIPCISQKECLGDLSACFANACQATLIAEMKAQGFCVLSSEPWHFEKPKMSTTCK